MTPEEKEGDHEETCQQSQTLPLPEGVNLNDNSDWWREGLWVTAVRSGTS